jgi:hypothetical protein
MLLPSLPKKFKEKVNSCGGNDLPTVYTLRQSEVSWYRFWGTVFGFWISSMGSHPCDGINSMGRYQLVDIVRDFAKL